MNDGLVTRRSAHDVGETVSVLRAEAERMGAAVAAVVDHAAAARKAGLSMPATQVISFGDPQAGTPLMQARPEIAVDLPMRLMVRDDGQPGSLVTWQDPAYLAQRYGLGEDHLAPLNAPGQDHLPARRPPSTARIERWHYGERHSMVGACRR